MGDRALSSYLEHLPAELRRGPFLGRFLLAFEAVLSGGVDLAAELEGAPLDPALEADLGREGLEQLIARVHEFFDPDRAPEDFLPWLAGWVAASLRDDWTPATKRAFIGQIVPLYRERGTRIGIERVLRLSGEDAKVIDFADGLDDAAEAKEFNLGAGPPPPHFFGVLLTINEPKPDDPQQPGAELARRVRRVCAIVDREKPAHAYYALRIRYPAMRINNAPKSNPAFGAGITVGKTTILGTT
jgi:phage tail-like protein